MTIGKAANTSPAQTPARAERSVRPITPTPNAAAAITATDGSRSASSPVPATRATGHSIR